MKRRVKTRNNPANTGPLILRNLLPAAGARHNSSKLMPLLPQPPTRPRPPRAKLGDDTPVVLRFQDGSRSSGRLLLVSVTGGLLSVPKPATQGAMVKVMFLTRKGPVLGAAQMLAPLSWDQQPFRFVSMYDDDHSRLHAAIHASIEQARRDDKHSLQEQGRLERLRAW